VNATFHQIKSQFKVLPSPSLHLDLKYSKIITVKLKSAFNFYFCNKKNDIAFQLPCFLKYTKKTIPKTDYISLLNVTKVITNKNRFFFHYWIWKWCMSYISHQNHQPQSWIFYIKILHLFLFFFSPVKLYVCCYTFCNIE
jgi:hypothetical protein